MFSSIKNVLLILLIFVNPTDAMLKGKLSKNLRKMKIAGLVVGAVVKMKKLVGLSSDGDKNTIDPTCTEATSTAALAMDAFNLKRKTNGLPAYSIKKIVSYQTQLVAGKLHIFCIETVEDGYVQLTWNNVAFGEPHLVSVFPLTKVFNWVGESPASEFMCSTLPLPLDPRKDTSRVLEKHPEFQAARWAEKYSSLLETDGWFSSKPSHPYRGIKEVMEYVKAQKMKVKKFKIDIPKKKWSTWSPFDWHETVYSYFTAKEAAVAYDRVVLKANRSKTLLNFPEMADMEEEKETGDGLPKSWDARVDHKRSWACKELINKVHNQGTCGSCYAFAALGTASIRACIAGHKVKHNWYSVQDVLNCGSDREGSFQNAVKDGAEGTTFAGNCAGHWAGNVFEYATKYGLVDPHCQKYAHGGDPLTHFDKGAGADKKCMLTNNGKTAVTPKVKVSVPFSTDYVNLLTGLKDELLTRTYCQRLIFNYFQQTCRVCFFSYSVHHNNCLHRGKPSSAQMEELKKLSDCENNSCKMTWLSDDETVLELLRSDGNKEWVTDYLSPETQMLTYTQNNPHAILKMTLNQEIKPGQSVTVDNMRFCEAHSSYTTNMEEIESSTDSGEPHCLAYKRDQDVMTVTCKTNADVSVELNGPAGSTTGGLDMAICKCAAENREFKQNGKSVDIDEKAVQFSELGNGARGTCLREKDGTFDEKHKVEGCVPNKIFHTPVTVRGDTQSELVMKKAIQEGGAIAVSFATTKSFMNFDGEGVWDIEEGESLDGGHAILFFGWGEEKDGKTFWWAKNSWGKSPAAIFKFARGTDAANIESRGASWLSVSPPGVANEQSVALTTKANGFCPDSLLHESLLADPTKVENACVSLKCDGKGECEVTWGPTCPKVDTETTTVNIISDSKYGDISKYGHKVITLDTETACIANVYTEDRSKKTAEAAKTEDTADSRKNTESG